MSTKVSGKAICATAKENARMPMVTFTKAIGSMTFEPVAESVVLRTGTSTKAVSATIYAMAMASRRTVVKDPTNEVRQRTLGSGPMAFAVALAARLIATALRMRVSGITTNVTGKVPCSTQTARLTLVSGKTMNVLARASTPWPISTSTRANSCTISMYFVALVDVPVPVLVPPLRYQ